MNEWVGELRRSTTADNEEGQPTSHSLAHTLTDGDVEGRPCSPLSHLGQPVGEETVVRVTRAIIFEQLHGDDRPRCTTGVSDYVSSIVLVS